MAQQDPPLAFKASSQFVHDVMLDVSEMRFRDIFDSTFQFIGLLGPDGTLLEANRTALEFGGLSAADVVGRPFWEARWWAEAPDPETPVRLRSAVARAASGEFVRYEVEVRGAGERTAFIDFSLRPVHDDNSGAVVFIVPEGRDISERLVEDSRLRAAEERLRLAQEAAGLGVWECQPDTGAYWFSPEYLRLYGVSPAQAAAFGMDQWLAALHPDDRERVRAARSAMLCTGHLDEEFRIRRLDTGELRWIHSKAARFDRPSGPLFIGINHDITARKLAIEAARERDQRLRMAFAATGTFAWEWDVTTGRVEWSEQGEAALRLPPGGFGGTVEAFRALVHPDDRPDVEAALTRALTGTDNEYVAEFRMRRGDGTWRRTATRGIVQRDGSGRPLRVFGVDHDLSARPLEAKVAALWPHEAVEALRLTEQRYRAALRGPAIVVFEQDLDLRYTWIDNPALGYQAKEVVGCTDFDLFEDAEDAARLTALKRRVIASSIGLREEVSLWHQGALRHYDLSVEPLRDGAGAATGVICAAVDVTERRRNEAALEESQERFDRAADAARLAAYEVGSDKIARVTRKFWDMYGLPPDTPFDFSTLLSRVHPDDRPGVIADHERLAATGGTFRAEFRIVRPDGSIGWLETRGEAQAGTANFPARIEGVILDITERKAAEAERRDREQQLRGVLDGMAEGFGILAPDFTILEQNREALRIDGAAARRSSGARTGRCSPAANTGKSDVFTSGHWRSGSRYPWNIATYGRTAAPAGWRCGPIQRPTACSPCSGAT